MIVWRDEGVLLSARRHGEGDAIIEALTAEHGRCAAVVKGGASRRQAAFLQPGDQIALDWRARLDAHLGTGRVEPVKARAARVMGDARALAALASATALLVVFLPERAPQPALYAATTELLDALAQRPDWPARYARWERDLLAEIGFGLDLASCAATGARDDLVWVSPKSGQAVSRTAGAPWAARLLPLPGFLRDPRAGATDADIADALRLTGHFLGRWAAPAFERASLPPARARLAALFGA